jgi:hypothetical protein
MAISAFGGINTFVPQVTKNLIINYSRDPKKYAINQLMKLVPVEKETGYYIKINPDEQGRNLDFDNQLWIDGGARPVDQWNRMKHQFVQYNTTRFSKSQPIGYKSAKQADFPLKEAQAQQLAVQAMNRRAKQFYTLLGTSGTYLAGFTDTATNYGGGAWSSATSSNRYIQKSLHVAAQLIERKTQGSVRMADLTVVMSPTVANAIARSSEVADAYIQSPFATALMGGDDLRWVQGYGLPPYLYGMRVVVDPTIETTTRENAAGTATNAYIPSTTDVYVLLRAGDMTNNVAQAATDFSSVACFVWKDEEMLTEEFDEPINKRSVISVTDNFEIKAVANETMVRITAAVS